MSSLQDAIQSVPFDPSARASCIDAVLREHAISQALEPNDEPGSRDIAELLTDIRLWCEAHSVDFHEATSASTRVFLDAQRVIADPASSLSASDEFHRAIETRRREHDSALGALLDNELSINAVFDAFAKRREPWASALVKEAEGLHELSRDVTVPYNTVASYDSPDDLYGWVLAWNRVELPGYDSSLHG